MITMIKMMLKVKITKNIKKKELCESSFLTIAITITTNKTHITNKTYKTKAYSLHPNYEETILPNM